MRAALVGAVVVLVSLLVAPAALAHPLGNFTRNVFVGLVVGPDAIDVTVRLDLAELPTLQERQANDADGDGVFNDDELAAFAASSCAEATAQVSVGVAGVGLPTSSVDRTTWRLDAGEAGLDTLLVTCRGVIEHGGDLATEGRPVVMTVASAVEQGGQGWHELVVVGSGGVAVVGDVRQVSTSEALLVYPEGPVMDERAARVELAVTAAAGVAPVPAWASADDGDADEVERVVDRDLAGGGFLEGATGRFTDLVGERELTPGFVLLAIVLALVLGGAHALAPGHGKTVMAAYVVGQRGTFRQALAIAGVVAVTHTAGVLALGLVLSAGEAVVPQDLYPWFTAVSGLLLVAVGVDLLRRTLRSRAAARLASNGHRHAHATAHDHDHHDHHDHAHGRDRDRGHVHVHHHPRNRGPAAAAQHGSDPAVAVPGAVVVSVGAGAATGVSDATGEHGRGDRGMSPAAGVAVGVGPAPDRHAPDGDRADLGDGWVVHDHGSGAHAHPVPGADVTPRTLVAMGMAGGLVPSPSALLVLLGAIAIGRTAFGVVLVVTYGLGLATTLVGGGLLLVVFRERAEGLLARRRGGRLGRLLDAMPVLTAVAVLVGALLLVGRGVLL